MATERIEMPCHWCKRDQRQVLKGTVRRDYIEGDLQEVYEYDVLECLGCGNGNFRIRSSFNTGGADDDVKYLPRIPKRASPSWLHRVDRPISSMLREIYTAITNDANTLAVLGARTVLDRLIQDQVGDQGGFEKGLKKMKAEGNITSQQYEVLKVAVAAGHAAAHRGHRFDARQIATLMNIVEHLVELFYVVGSEAAELKAQTPARPPRKARGTTAT